MDQFFRNKLIDLIYNNLETKYFSDTQVKIKKLFGDIKNYTEKTEFMKNLLIDLIDKDPNHGQIEKAFSREYFKKWT